MYNNDHDVNELHSLITTAERDRNSKNTTALKEYVDNHPQIAAITLGMTEEIKQKLLVYMSNVDQSKQSKIQEELDELRRHLENMSSKPNILHTLLAEEIQLSYLFLRHADTVYARHYANLSTLALRRMETAQIRFLRAVKTLASIQKLPPFLNVNLGTQQIALTS